MQVNNNTSRPTEILNTQLETPIQQPPTNPNSFSQQNFLQLPEELIIRIIDYLPLDSLSETMLVSKKLNKISEKSNLSLSIISEVKNIILPFFDSFQNKFNTLAHSQQNQQIEDIFNNIENASFNVSSNPFICLKDGSHCFDTIINILRSCNSYMTNKNKYLAFDQGNSHKTYKLLAEYSEFKGASQFLMDDQGTLHVYDTSLLLMDNNVAVNKKPRRICLIEENNNKFSEFTIKKCEIDCLIKIIHILPNM